MKISDVKVSRQVGPFGWCLIQIDTDEGLSGLGEAPMRATVLPTELARLRSALIGQSPLNAEPLLRGLQYQVNSPITLGIDMALLDLCGKYMNAPLWAILGGKYRSRIRIYSDSHAGIDWDPIGFAHRVTDVQENGRFLDVYRPEAFARHATDVVKQGFTAIKFDIDFPTPTRYDFVDRSISPAELRGIIDAVAAVREAIGPDVDLAIDCHARYNVADALRIAYEVEPFKLMWLEDPVPPRNVETMAKVTAKARVPICTGESLHGRHGFQDLVTKQAADIIQPDTPRSGSIREIKRIAELAEMYHISIAPHNMTSPVATMAAVHLCASVPNFLALEFHCGGMPWWNDLAQKPKPILDRGYIAVPDAPGLGLELDFDVVQQHVDGPLWLE